MKALDHYSKAERLERLQATLNDPDYGEVVIPIVQAAGHHFICAGLEWPGHDPQAYGHAHGKHANNMKAAGAAPEVIKAWIDLDQLRTKSLYGGNVPPASVAEARSYLLTLHDWAKGLHP